MPYLFHKRKYASYFSFQGTRIVASAVSFLNARGGNLHNDYTLLSVITEFSNPIFFVNLLVNIFYYSLLLLPLLLGTDAHQKKIFFFADHS
jgi:hypothetical protein